MSERQSIALIGLIVLLAAVSFVACIGMVAIHAHQEFEAIRVNTNSTETSDGR